MRQNRGFTESNETKLLATYFAIISEAERRLIELIMD